MEDSNRPSRNIPRLNFVSSDRNSEPSSQNTKQHFNFFGLPHELREMVYGFLFQVRDRAEDPWKSIYMIPRSHIGRTIECINAPYLPAAVGAAPNPTYSIQWKTNGYFYTAILRTSKCVYEEAKSILCKSTQFMLGMELGTASDLSSSDCEHRYRSLPLKYVRNLIIVYNFYPPFDAYAQRIGEGKMIHLQSLVLSMPQLKKLNLYINAITCQPQNPWLQLLKTMTLAFELQTQFQTRYVIYAAQKRDDESQHSRKFREYMQKTVRIYFETQGIEREITVIDDDVLFWDVFMLIFKDPEMWGVTPHK
jgi:hypothetical protein